MTVTTTNISKTQTADGVKVSFDWNFKIFGANDLNVYLNGVLKSYVVDYSVVINMDGTGTVTFLTPPGNGVTILMRRNLALTQLTVIPVEDKIPNSTLNNIFDRLTMFCQQIQDGLNRSFQLSQSSTATPNLTIPDPTANDYLRWDPTGTFLLNDPGGGGGTTIINQGGGGLIIPAGNQNKFPQVNGNGTDFTYLTNAQLASTINVAQYVLNKSTTLPTGAGTLTLSNGSIVFAGMLVWYTGNDIVYQRDQNNANWWPLWKIGGGLVPNNFASGPAPQWLSASTVRIPSGFQCNDSTNHYPIAFGVNADVSLAASGVNGREGVVAETIDARYFLYAIGDSTGVNPSAGVWSTVNEKVTGSINLPTGYNLKRQLNSYQNDHSSNLIPSTVGMGWPNDIFLQTYDVDFTDTSGVTLGATNVLNVGTANNAWHPVANVGFISPNSTKARLNIQAVYQSASGSVRFRQTGSGLAEGFSVRPYVSSQFAQVIKDIALDASQSWDYLISTAGINAYVDIEGYYDRL